MNDLLWILLALALFPSGWFAGVQFSRRKIDVLQGEVDNLRKTAEETATQARRQIRQLRTELAARPPLASARAASAAAAAAPSAANASAVAGSSRAALEKQIREYDAAAARTNRSGFADTQVMDDPDQP